MPDKQYILRAHTFINWAALVSGLMASIMYECANSTHTMDNTRMPCRQLIVREALSCSWRLNSDAPLVKAEKAIMYR